MVIPKGFRDRRTVRLLAVVLFATVTALCFYARGSDSEGLPLLFVLPVALLSASDGLRGGIAGAGAALALFAAWALSKSADVNAIGYATHALAFLVVGGSTGYFSGQRSRIGAEDSRWFEMSNDMLVEASLDGYFTRLSVRWEQCLGWSREELMSRPFREFIHPDDLAATLVHAESLDESPGEVVNFENRYSTKDGSWRWLLWSARSDEHRKYAVARDITDRKRLEEERQALLGQVEAMARTDSLTGLPNRRSWDEEIRRAVARSQRDGSPLALAMVDLDHFKLFNDQYGHAAGDALLKRAAVQWRLALRVTDFLARYGGEEFAILLPGCPLEEAERLIDRFRSATPQDQTCSVGIALWVPSDSSEDLVARADAALYDAKRLGRDRVVTTA